MTSATRVTRHPQGLVLTRRFTASPARVFLALSRAEHLQRWWGPPACPVVECVVDFRPGGLWHYRLRSADGREHWTRAVYTEIVPPERISYVEHSSDAHGAITAARPEARVSLTLEPVGEGTLFTAHIRYGSGTDRDRMIGNGIEHGFSEALDQLDALLCSLNAPDRAGR